MNNKKKPHDIDKHVLSDKHGGQKRNATQRWDKVFSTLTDWDGYRGCELEKNASISLLG